MGGLLRRAGWSVLMVGVAVGMLAVEPTPVGAASTLPAQQTEPPEGEDIDASDLPPLESAPPAPPPNNPGAPVTWPPCRQDPLPGPCELPATPPTSTAAAALAWQPLGGNYVLDPTALSNGNVVFSIAAGLSDVGGRPFYHERIGDSWSRPRYLGGFLLSTVAPAHPLLEPQRTEWEIFGVGGDSAVWYRTRSSAWQSLGGVLISDPTAVTWQGVTYVFGVGLDQAVWYRSTTSEWQSLGGVLFSDLAVTTDGTNLYVLGLAPDGSLWSQRRTGSTWSGWEGLGGEAVGWPTTAHVSNTGYVFVVGLDDAIWYKGVSGGAWSGWYTLGGGVASFAAPIGRDGGLDVFVVGNDLAMYSQRWDGSAWSGWRDDGGGFLSNPAAGASHVFGIGFDRQIWAAPVR